jgi:hypothetical protein
MAEEGHWKHQWVATIMLSILTTALFALGFFKSFLWALSGVCFLILLWSFKSHPRVALILAKSPVRLRSPIVRVSRSPRIVPIPPELGRLDFELRFSKASNEVMALLGKMGDEMTAHNPRLLAATAKIKKSANESVAVRQKVMNSAARVVEKHARRMGALESKYRSNVQEMTVNSKRWIEAVEPNEDLSELKQAVAGFLVITEESRDSTAEYQAAAMRNRAQSISQTMNGAWDELIRVLGRIIEDATMMVDFGNWVAALP